MARQQTRATAYLSIADFDRVQHYRDRALIWIKTYVDLLDNYEFVRLPDASKFHRLGLTLLAARMGNRLPNDPEFLAKQIGANTPIDLEAHLRDGFLIPVKYKRTKAPPASKPLAEQEPFASADKDKRRGEETRREGDVFEAGADAPPQPNPEVFVTAGGSTAKRDPRAHHPAVVAAKKAGGRWPPSEIWDLIVTELGDTPDNDKLRACRAEWRARGYNPASWMWLLEWYAAGIPRRDVSAKSDVAASHPDGTQSATADPPRKTLSKLAEFTSTIMGMMDSGQSFAAAAENLELASTLHPADLRDLEKRCCRRCLGTGYEPVNGNGKAAVRPCNHEQKHSAAQLEAATGLAEVSDIG